jgi:hypothetical protein
MRSITEMVPSPVFVTYARKRSLEITTSVGFRPTAIFPTRAVLTEFAEIRDGSITATELPPWFATRTSGVARTSGITAGP